MSAATLVEWVTIAECILCTTIFFLMWKKQTLHDFPMLAAFISVCRACSSAP